MLEHGEKMLATQSWVFPNAPPVPSTMPLSKKVIVDESPYSSTAPVEGAADPAAKNLEHLVSTDAQRDADFYSVLLPSNFHLYPFKTLSVKQVKGRQQAKFNRAAAEENSRYLIEGVSSLLGDNIDAGVLTPGDFYWLLYWILFASYPSFKRNVTITCAAPAHVAKVAGGELEESSLRYLHQYTRPSIKETLLDVGALQALDLSILKRDNIQLGYFSMHDTLSWAENRAGTATAEDYFTYELAVYLKGGTLDERAEVVRDMSVAQTSLVSRYRSILQEHGVVGTIKSNCKECGAEAENIISVSASDFL